MMGSDGDSRPRPAIFPPSMQTLGVVDFGGQYTHLIARRIRQFGVYSEVLSPLHPPANWAHFKGLIFSGGPSSVYEAGAPDVDAAYLKAGLPILGLCYGHQILSQKLGGQVKRGLVHEFGPAEFAADITHPLFKGVSPKTKVWMSHGDEVAELPIGFRFLGSTADCRAAAVGDDARKYYGVQFHPEVTHTPEGGIMLKNFLELCGCDFTWKMTDHIETLCARLRRECGTRKAFLLVSGGVDSTVAFALLNRALGPDRVLGLHIDNGLMRQDESRAVMDYMQDHGFHNLVIRDATDDFLKALEGVVEPEKKRKIIGDTFLTVKDAALADLKLNPDEWVLAQGTIYPDTIESGGTAHAAVIKTHHNRVDAIVELMKRGLVVEPLAECYKDEVRELGRLLEIPDRLIDRHPFPGPGLGVRVLCRAELGRESQADQVPEAAKTKVAEALRSLAGQGVQGEILPVRSVGVQGDGRTYAHPCVIRGLRDWDRADETATALLNRVREINRVVLEVGALESGLGFSPVAATCSRDRLDTLRRFDHACTEALFREGLYAKVWQMPVVLLPLNHADKPVVVLRPVDSTEAMTASFARLPWPMLEKLWQELKALGAGAMLYDITHKPPGTIEWE